MSAFLPSLSMLFFSACLFGFACVVRSSCYAGLMDRPICIAAIWGIFSGDWSLAIPLGIFFELFWMDLLGAGTYIPPNANMPLLLCLMLNEVLPLQVSASEHIPLLFMVITLPLAYLATSLEQKHRQDLISVHDKYVEQGQMKEAVGPFVIAQSIFGLWFMESLLFVLLAVALFWLSKGLITVFGTFPSPHNLGWPVLWLVAALGGVLALRTKRAIVSLFISFGVLSILLLHG